MKSESLKNLFMKISDLKFGKKNVRGPRTLNESHRITRPQLLTVT